MSHDDSKVHLDLEGDLNEAQRRAVTAADGPLLVVAGAGTGKTRTLVYRVAHLIERGVAPESILLLTFTRRAAQEMIRRASALLDDRCGRVAGGTFHSFANLVLRRFGDLVGHGEGFTILDRGDAADLVGALRTESGFVKRGRRFPRKESLLDLFSKHVNTGRPLAELLADDLPDFVDDLAAITTLQEQYRTRKKAQNVMDYDDLLVHLRDLLVRHEEVRGRLAASYRAVLVDEYQDTNRLQAHITALLGSGHGNVMVVGDEAQSIYAFRGASFRNIVDFPKLFPSCTTVVLEQNYRSTQPILDLGNAVLRGARERFEKRLFTDLDGGPRPVYVRTDDEAGQASFVAERVLALREEGVGLDRQAILVRAAWHSNALELELANRNIPFRKFGGARFAEAAHVKDAVALLRLASNPCDEAAWLRVLQLHEGIGPATAQRISRAVLEAAGDLSPLVAKNVARARYGPPLGLLCTLLADLRRDGRSTAERVDTALAYIRKGLRRRFEDAGRRGRDLDSIGVMGRRYSSLDAFLTDLAIDPPSFRGQDRDQDPDDELLTLSTVHSAKGLEWHTVFVLGLNDGMLPSWAARDDPDAFEEERRLFYVAVTRARRGLYLVRAETTTGRGYRERATEPSPFLTELDLPKLVETIVHTPHAAAPRWGDDAPVATDEAALKRIQAYFGDE